MTVSNELIDRLLAESKQTLKGWGRTGIFMQGDHHDKVPGWTAASTQSLCINSRMTSLAMNSGYRFE
jgi:hypothetical protein